MVHPFFDACHFYVYGILLWEMAVVWSSLKSTNHRALVLCVCLCVSVCGVCTPLSGVAVVEEFH